MERYRLVEEIGAGTYGVVWKAKNDSGEVVAIKRLKESFDDWTECVTLREVESLRSVSEHANIVGIKELIREKDSHLHLVFEFMPDGNLLHLIKENLMSTQPRIKLTTEKVFSIVRQIFVGLSHIHSCGYFHRDIKPENLLMRGDTCKIADFGLARKYRCNSNAPPLTEYISTRWYRAPEVLLCSPDYGSPIDIFAVGLVMVELLALKPLFPGTSDLDQIFKIFNILGTPKEDNWEKGMYLMKKMSTALPADTLHEKKGVSQMSSTHIPLHLVKSRRHFVQLIPTASAATISFIQNLLRLDPSERPTARECFTSQCLQLSSQECKKPRILRIHPHPQGIRNTTPPLEKEMTSKRKYPLHTSNRYIKTKMSVTSQQINSVLQICKNSEKSSHNNHMPPNFTTYGEPMMSHEYFTNFERMHYGKESTKIHPGQVGNIALKHQSYYNEKPNRCSGFGLLKFRQHSWH